MDDHRIYEKIKEYEKLGKSDSDVIIDLCVNDSVEVERVLNKLFEANERRHYAQMVIDAYEGVEPIRDFDDLGITMIDTDEDW